MSVQSTYVKKLFGSTLISEEIYLGKMWQCIKHVDDLVQNCSDSVANVLGLLQYCTEPSMYKGVKSLETSLSTIWTSYRGQVIHPRPQTPQGNEQCSFSTIATIKGICALVPWLRSVIRHDSQAIKITWCSQHSTYFCIVLCCVWWWWGWGWGGYKYD